MWGALEDTRRDVDADYKDHLDAGKHEFRHHRRLGIFVVIMTTIVGTSVFGALTQSEPNFYVQAGTGVLSILAAVLAAVQAFYDFEARSRAHLEYAMEYYALKREIDQFFDRFPSNPLDPIGAEECRKESGMIHRRYADAKAKAPIIPARGGV